MSSSAVRTTIKNKFAADFPALRLIDFTDAFQDIAELLAEQVPPMTTDDHWIGIDFVGNSEMPITINSTNVTGKYREYGAVYFHIVDVAKLGVGAIILARGELIRNAYRGQNLSGVRINSMTPLSFDLGATLQFEAGYLSASFIMEYEKDIDL